MTDPGLPRPGDDEPQPDEAALAHLTALLAAEPTPVLPDDVAARLDAALAAEPPLRPSVGVPATATVTPLAGRRRAGRALLAAAAGVTVLVAGVGAALSGGWLQTTTESASDVSATAGRASAGPVVLRTGTDYDSALVDASVPALLGGPGVPADNLEIAPEAATTGGGAPQADGPEPGPGADLYAAATPLDRLSEPAALQGCLTELSGSPGTTPLLLDYASFEGRPALVVALEGLSDDRLDVFVVGGACAPGTADLLLYRSVLR